MALRARRWSQYLSLVVAIVAVALLGSLFVGTGREQHAEVPPSRQFIRDLEGTLEEPPLHRPEVEANAFSSLQPREQTTDSLDGVLDADESLPALMQPVEPIRELREGLFVDKNGTLWRSRSPVGIWGIDRHDPIGLPPTTIELDVNSIEAVAPDAGAW